MQPAPQQAPEPPDAIDPPLLGRRLRVAREARGLTQQQVADELSMARTTMVAVEKGARRVRPEELVRLAELYGRSVSELLQRGEPAEDLAAQLRGALPPVEEWVEGGVAVDPVDAEAVAGELAEGAEELRRLCEDYAWLEELRGEPLRQRYPAEYGVDDRDPELAAEDVAAAERNRMGLGDGPLHQICEVLDVEVGARVFEVELPAGVRGLYAYSRSLGACMAVNLRHDPEERRVDLARLYSRFLTERYRPWVDLARRYERRPAGERFAATFAAAFLLPEASVRRQVLSRHWQPPGGERTDALLMAHYFGIPESVLVQRLAELKLLPSSVIDTLQGQAGSARRGLRSNRLVDPERQFHALPLRFVALVVDAWGDGEVSEGEAARLLRTDRVTARRWADRLHGLLGAALEGEDPTPERLVRAG